MTERLFDKDAYLTEFTAGVISCEKTEKGFDTVLDKTAFFPEGGGQFCDLGVIGGAEVLDVQEDKEGIIHHLLASPINVGGEIPCKIDFARRFDFMQQHSGEHIFSGLAHENFGANNVGFHLGLNETLIDLDVPLGEESVAMLERKANEAIYKNIPIEISYPTEKELAVLPYRSKKALTGAIRIVTVPGYDICACCGTHCRRTGEIGIIKVTSFQNYKGGTRLFMLCGGRAFGDYQRKNSDVLRVTNRLSVKPEEIDMAVSRLESEITEHKIYESSLRKELFGLKAEALGTGDKICVFEKNLSPDELRRYCITLADNFGVAAVFAGENGNYKYALVSKTENCSVIAKEINAKFNGRGGGKPELCQGSCAGNEEEIRNFFDEV